MLNRARFLAVTAAAAATVTALQGPAAIAAAASESPPLGVSARYPGFILRAFADVTSDEVYLAYSADALRGLSEPDDDVPAGFVELHPDTVLSNAGVDSLADDATDAELDAAEAADRACNGRCGMLSAPVAAHSCLVVRDEIARRVALINSGQLQRDSGKQSWHPSTAGMVATIWTEYA